MALSCVLFYELVCWPRGLCNSIFSTMSFKIINRFYQILIVYLIFCSHQINFLCDKSLSDQDSHSSIDLNKQIPTSVVQDSGDYSRESFPDEPLQIVRPDDTHKNLVIVEENVKFLSSFTEPVSVISVVGKFHSGKSFLMNQLMSKSKGFGIGSKVSPETMGIWMWGKPIKLNDDKDYKVYTLMLDTEGFAATNISEIYDAKIFAVSTLMSSLLLYNSVKIIDQSDVDYLELLARRTQLFALRAMMTPQANSIDELNQEILKFPALIWVIQDFVQENEEVCKDWLLKLFQTHVREDETYPISLKDIFPSVDCHTLFIPCAKKQLLQDLSLANDSDLLPDYLIDRTNLVEKIRQIIKPKYLDTKPLTGKELVWLLRMLTSAANAGSMTEVPNRWDAFLDKLKESSIVECFKFYVSRINFFLEDQVKGEPVNRTELLQWHHDSQHKAVTLLRHLLQGLESYWTVSEEELIGRIQHYFTKVTILNDKKIKLKISSLKSCYEKQMVSEFSLFNFPTSSKEIMAKADHLKSSYEQQLKADLKYLCAADELNETFSSLERTIMLHADSAKLKNSKYFSAYFDKIIHKIINDSFSTLSVDLYRPKLKSEFETFLNGLNNEILKRFAKKTEKFHEEPEYEAALNKLKVLLHQENQELRKQTEISVEKFLIKELDDCAHGFSYQVSSEMLHFPIEDSELKEIIKQKKSMIKETCVEPLTVYSDYECFPKVLFDARVKFDLIEKRAFEENVKAFKKEVELPLSLAKKTVSLASPSYTTYYSFRQFIHDVCMIQLNQGKAKDWSPALKTKIINLFMEDDEILDLLNSKRGIWSSIIGFFQWIFSFFYWLFSFFY